MKLLYIQGKLYNSNSVKKDYIELVKQETRRDTIEEVVKYLEQIKKKVSNEECQKIIHKLTICIKDDFGQ